MVSDLETTQTDRQRAVSPAERQQMWDWRVMENLSYVAIGKRLNRDRETVARHIDCPAFKKYQDAYKAEQLASAIKRLQDYAPDAAEDWKLASKAAAAKGEHRPAKELLIATGAIERDTKGQTVNQNVIVLGGRGRPIPMEASLEAALRPPVLVGSVEQPINGYLDAAVESACGNDTEGA